GYTALHFAAYHGHLNVIEVLIEAGATVDMLEKENKGTSLIEASKTGGLEIVKALVEAGADAFLADKYGRTALHYAVMNGHFDLAQYLLSIGANAESVDTSDNTAL
ncbi:ankyrin repeat-containing domain protein, partial [Chytridium lagenaria]